MATNAGLGGAGWRSHRSDESYRQFLARIAGDGFRRAIYVGSLNFATGPLSFYAKAASRISAGPFFVKLNYSDGIEEVPFFGTLTTSWQHLSYPVDGEKNLRRIQFGTGEGGSIYIDDVSLQGRRIPLMRMSILDLWSAAGTSIPAGSAAAREMLEEMMEGYGTLDERLAQVEARLGPRLAKKLTAKR